MRNAYLQMCDYGSRFRILKGGKISLVVSALIASVTMLQASPSGGVVTAGAASIAQSGLVTNITQTTNKASINWNNFSIAKNETVNFNQPTVSSITLNRVVGNEKSIIDGAMNANGQVFILNSNGLLFSKNASINTAGLVATTMNLSDTDFMNGNYTFKGESQASIINQGTINISDKGYAALFGKEVINEGIIKATLGKAELVGAKEVTLNLNGNSLVSLHVNKGVLDALVENKGAIYADGGEVYLTTNAVNELLKGVVNNTGIIEANTLDDITGKIELYAHGGTTNVGGTLDASAPNGGDGGFIETSGKTVNIQPDSFVSTKSSTGNTGTWLIDPNDFIVAATGGNMTGAQLQTQLASTNFVIETTTMGDDGGAGHGDIFINDAVSWSANKLTLKAQRHINVNAVMSMSGTASIDMGYGWNGTTYGNAVSGVASGINMGFNSTNTGYAGKINITAPSTNAVTINGNSYTIISDVAGLNNLAANTRYVVASDIDVSSIADWTGKSLTYTSFDLNGFGHVISGLTSTTNGLINSLVKGTGTVTASIENIGLDSLNVNSTNTASIGGLIGSAENVTIKNSFVSGSVRGSYDRVGGLVGLLYANTANGAGVDNSFTKGTVTGTNNGGEIGGLVAQTSGDLSLINYSFSESTVSGSSYEVGGLIGALGNANGSISNSYWKGVSVTGNTIVGGLVGGNNGNISNSYAAGRVTALTSGGNGLAGGTVSNSYFVTSLISNAGSMGDQANAKADPAALVAAMGSSYELLSGNTLPTLKSKYATSSITATPWTPPATPVSYTLSHNSYIYTGNEITLNLSWLSSAIFGSTYSSWSAGMDYVFKDSGGHIVTGYTNAGTYSGLYIDILKSGFTEASSGNAAGSLTITKAPLTITASNASKTYNGVAYSGGNGVTYSGFVGGQTSSVLGGSVSYGGTSQSAIDAGDYVITPSGLSSSNYALTYVDGVLTIKAPAPVTPPQLPKIVDSIVSGVAVQPPVMLNFTPPTPPAPAPQQFSFGGQMVQLMSTPNGGTPTYAVSMQEVRQMQQEGGSNGGGSPIGDIRVPLMAGSLIDLVNGGVRLPNGVEQEFFMAQR